MASLTCLFGPGDGELIAHIADRLDGWRARRVLLVTGSSSFRRSPRLAELLGGLRDFRVAIAPPAACNPTTDAVDSARDRVTRTGPEAIIGIGGGSAIDVAKMLSMLIPSRVGSTDEVLRHGFEATAEAIPLIAIPTTSGSGSEATPFASLVTADRRKVSIEDARLIPTLAILDPGLTHTLPPYVTAVTGFDALCQSIESFWSARNTPASDEDALHAIRLIRGNLPRAVDRPSDRGARLAMSLASCHAGRAIARTRTTAVHSVSYPLTTRFGIPHGHACALTLASFIRYNAEAIPEDRARVLWRSLGCGGADEAACYIESLMTATGLERRLSRLGIDRGDLAYVVEEGFRPDRVGNNPRRLTCEDLTGMLSKLL